ncbi:hypothetical protein C8T65DRAFT_737271 [Cerioporus squamosus]|nr:hypothetical protein C8T65DRAFT_737271 [Cerioporus squamosus]
MPRFPTAQLYLRITIIAMDFGSDIFLRKDAGTPHLPGIPLTDLIVIVNGPTAVEPFTLLLPIDSVQQVTAAKISGWLAALSGPSVAQADMKPSQREMLLKLVCDMCACLKHPLGVLNSNWVKFIHLLTRAATHVGPLESATAALEPVTTWLEDTFPANVFLPVYDQFEDPVLTVDNEVKKVEVIATLAMMLDPCICEALQARRTCKRAAQKARRNSGQSAADPVALDTDSTTKTTALDAPVVAAVPGVAPVVLGVAAAVAGVAPTVSEAAKGKRPAATVETDNEASEAESDDSMPSLRTATNSSNGESEDLNSTSSPKDLPSPGPSSSSTSKMFLSFWRTYLGVGASQSSLALTRPSLALSVAILIFIFIGLALL